MAKKLSCTEKKCFKKLFSHLDFGTTSKINRNITGQWNLEMSIDKLFEQYLKYSYPVTNFSNTLEGTALGVLCWKCRSYICHGRALWTLEARNYTHNTGVLCR